MKVLFDTSVLVPAIVTRHAQHDICWHWLEDARPAQFQGVVSTHTLAELYGQNHHLFRLIQASIGKEIGSINDGDDRRMAAINLSNSCAGSVPYLISLLSNFDSRICLDALTVLREQPFTFNTVSALPNIIRLLKDPNSEVRLKAMSVLGVLREDAKATLPTLTEFLSDPDPKIRDATANSISCLNGAERKYCDLPSSKELTALMAVSSLDDFLM